MSIQFDKNYYTEALDKKSINSELKELKLQYGNATYNAYSIKYEDAANHYLNENDDFFECAISTIVAVAVTIYELSITIILGTLNLITGNVDVSLAYIFIVLRDLQECFGYLISFFNERLGLYHIQESRFHRTCYEHFITNKNNNIDSESDTEDKSYSESESSESSTGSNNRPGAQPDFTAPTSNPEPQPPPSFSNPIPETPEVPKNTATVLDSPQEFHDAIKLIEKQYPSEKRGELKHALAEQYYAAGSLKNAYRVITEIEVDKTKRGAFCVKLAEAYLADNNEQKANDMMRDSYVDKLKRGKYFAEQAEKAFTSKNYEIAHEAITDSYVDHDLRGNFCIKAADQLYQDKNYSEAIKFISDTYVKAEDATELRKKICDKCLENNDWDNLDKVASKLPEDQKNFFLSKIVENCLTSQPQKAKTILRVMLFDMFCKQFSDIEILQINLVQVCLNCKTFIDGKFETIKSYFTNKNGASVLEILKGYAQDKTIKEQLLIGASQQQNFNNFPGFNNIPGFNNFGFNNIPGFNNFGFNNIPGFNNFGFNTMPGFNNFGFDPFSGFNFQPATPPPPPKKPWECPAELKDDQSKKGKIIKNILKTVYDTDDKYINNLNGTINLEGKSEVNKILCTLMESPIGSVNTVLKKKYHSIAMLIHPDKCPNDKHAQEAFQHLSVFYQAVMD